MGGGRLENNDVFFRFFRELEENLDANGLFKFLRSLNEGHLRFLDFQKVKLLKELMHART